jgi:hypothetical protein
MEEHIQGHFFGLEGGVARMDNQLPVVPALGQALDKSVWLLQAEGGYYGFSSFPNKAGERLIEARDGCLRLAGFQAARVRGDGFYAVIEFDFSRVLGNGFYGAQAILRVFYLHPHVQSFNFHNFR